MSGSDYGISAAIGAISSAIGANTQYIQNKKLAGIQEQYTKDNMGIAEQYNLENMAQQQQYNTASTAQAQNFEKSMADTTYQRGTADLKAAGLNPILAAGGQVDPTPNIAAPSGSAATVGAPSGPSVAPSQTGWSGAVQSGLAAANAVADLKNKLAQNSAINAAAARDNATAANTNAQVPGTTAGSTLAVNTEPRKEVITAAQEGQEMSKNLILGNQANYSVQQAAAQVAATNAQAAASSASAQNSIAQSQLAKENLILNPIKTGLQGVNTLKAWQ